MIPLLLALAAAVPPAPTPPPAPPRPNLASLVTQDDYPAESLRKGEQGTVRVRLDVTPEGRAGACTVTASSGYANLDAATCRVLVARSRFSPARDAAGNPTSDTVTTSVTWRLSEGSANPEIGAAVGAWVHCMVEAARPMVKPSLSSAAIADRVIGRCPIEEAEVLAADAKVPGSGPTTLPDARRAIRSALIQALDQMRFGG